jgi:SAM-dependent methyltransferase
VTRETDPYDLDAGSTEHYDDAELYDFEYRRRRADVTFYRGLAKDRIGGPAPDGFDVLELGCGTGRLLLPLARDGHAVIGVDRSIPMLRRLIERRDRLAPSSRARAHVLAADMRELALGARFPLVFIPFNAFQHMYSRVDVEMCLERVRALLAPGGRLVLDVLNPDLRWLARDPNKRWARTTFRHPRTKEKWVYTTNQTYDPVTQIAFMRIYYEHGDRTTVVRLCHRQFFPAELEALLAYGGFRIEKRFGGFLGEPFEGDSESQVLLCRIR